MARKLENWIKSFLQYTEQIPSPDLFKKWVALSTVAAALERKVWVDVGMGPLYPNLYAILVAPPGVGKTAMSSVARNILEELVTGDDKGLRLAQASLTSASVVDELRDASRRVYSDLDPLEAKKFNSLAVVANELGVFLPTYEPDMMNKLTDIYDGHGYSERRRWMKGSADEKGFNIPAPQINFLAATTPGYLTNMLPDGAWDQGFLSRVLLIFSGEKLVRPLFQFVDNSKTLRKQLVEDLKHIFTLQGEVQFEEEAKKSLIAWHMEGGPPTPDHPRLTHYVTRRTTHLIKICMLRSLADGDSLVISMDHFNQALNDLLEVELLMADIFKAMVVNADSKAIDECWHYAYQTFMKEGMRPIAEHRIVAFLQERVPIHNVMRMLDVMKSASILEEKLVEGVGRAYKPKARRP